LHFNGLSESTIIEKEWEVDAATTQKNSTHKHKEIITKPTIVATNRNLILKNGLLTGYDAI
jgi:hypothetical protein